MKIASIDTMSGLHALKKGSKSSMKSKKSLKQVYEENRLLYAKGTPIKIRTGNPVEVNKFMQKFYANQKKVRTRQTFLFIAIFTLLGMFFLLIF